MATTAKTDYLGLRILTSVLASKDLTLLDQLNITDFLPGKSQDVLAWIFDYRLQFNALPTPLAVVDNFGAILPADVEDFHYLKEQIVKRNLSYKLTQSLGLVAQYLDNGDPQRALTELSRVIDSGAVAPPSKVTTYLKDAKERIEYYKKQMVNQVFDGIPCVWEELGKVIIGWMNGTLNTILAEANVGKTWSLCIIADDCVTQNKQVLYISLEMPANKILRRIDALRRKVNFGRLRKNTLLPEDIKKLEESIITETTTGEIVVADKLQVVTPRDVFLLVKKHSPDIVLIDGAYRFEGDTRSQNKWEVNAKIITDLQLFAEMSNVPWVITSQLNPDPTRKATDKIQLAEARYSKEWGIAADVVLALRQAPEDRILRKMQIHALKVRENDSETDVDMVMVNWDLTNFNFAEIKIDLLNSMFGTP